MAVLTVAVAHFPARAGDPEGNLARMRPLAASAAAAGCGLILFAETCLHAYAPIPENLARAEPADGPLAGKVSALAREYGIVVGAGFWERDDEALHNTHAAFFPDGRRVFQRKHRLSEAELNAGVRPGPAARRVFEVDGARCAFLICADSASDAVWEDTVRQRVALRLHPTAGGGRRDEMMTADELAAPEGPARYEQARRCVFDVRATMPPPDAPAARGATRAFASANALGHDGVTDDGWHRGHCLIVDGGGVVRAQLPGTPVLEHQEAALAWAGLAF